MNTIPITIEEGRVTIRPQAGEIWITQHQIARLFCVFAGAVGSNVRSILKSGVLCEDEVCRHQTTPSGGVMTLYNMEMITALAFRLQSREAQQFRWWLIRQAVNPVILWKIPGINTGLN
jgi:hypothetical protein